MTLTFAEAKGKILRAANPHTGRIVQGTSWEVLGYRFQTNQIQIQLKSIPLGHTDEVHWTTLKNWLHDGRVVIEDEVSHGRY